MASSRICSIDGCGKPLYAHGFCQSHNRRLRLYGDPLATGTPGRPRGLTPSFHYLNEVAVPFKGDECLYWPFKVPKEGYPSFWHNGKSHRAHRYVCEAKNGLPPTAAHEAAHSCGNGHLGCINPGHLRWATRKENAADRSLHGRLVLPQRRLPGRS